MSTTRVSAKTVGATNWMEGIDGSTPISQLSIPGTHESCALYGGGKSQCQWYGITDQLRRGIRFLDVRCVYAHGSEGTKEFPIYHGLLYEWTNFEAVQDECVQFLKHHKDEAILMNVQREEPGGLVNKSADGFFAEFKTLIDSNSAYWKVPDQIPTLQDVRGKILLVRTPWDPTTEEGWPETPPSEQLGLPWNGFNIDGNSSNTLFVTQNNWTERSDPQKSAEALKAEIVEDYLLEAYQGTTSPDKIYLNFLSLAAGAYVGTAAQQINDWVLQYLQANLTGSGHRLGVLPMDFVGNTGWTGSLEDEIIRRNTFRNGYSFTYTVSPFKIQMTDPNRPGKSWYMIAGDQDWAVGFDFDDNKNPTSNTPIVFELYTYDGAEYYKVRGQDSYLSVSRGGQVGLYSWDSATLFTLGGPQLISHYANQAMRMKTYHNELWCVPRTEEGTAAVNVTFVPA